MTIAISKVAHELKAAGASIIHMEFGQPSTGAPAAAIAQAHRVLDADPMGYWASQPLKVWIDGKEVYQGRPADSPAQPDQASVPVELAAGEYTIVIEVKYRGPREALFARFLDPERKLTYPEPPKR